MNARGLVTLCLLVPAAHAAGQETLFLRPEAYTIAAQAPVRVRLEGAKAGAAVAWDNARIGWLFIRGQGTQENMDRAPGEPDATGAIALPAPPPGAAAAGVDFKPLIEDIEAEKLRTFAAARCAVRLPADVKGVVRLERRQSCKTFVRIGDEPRASGAVTAEGSQDADIMTQMDPTRAMMGSDVMLEAAMAGVEVEEARVIATSLATGKAQDVRISDEKRGYVRIDAAGVWRLEFHHLERAKEGSGADWVLTSATLTFEVPAPEVTK